MRRLLAAAILVIAAAIAGAAAYTAYDMEREYERQIATGDAAVAADQPYQALEAYSGAIVLKPDSMLAHLRRGMVYRERGELETALRDLRRAAELDPTATRPLELLGDVNMALQFFDRAAARYESYLQIDDRSAAVQYKLGLARYRIGQLQPATEALQRALVLDRSMPEAHFLLGLCRREQGDIPGARAELEAAMLLAPGLTSPREALAAVYSSTGHVALAVDQLEALAALEPARPERLVALGLAHANAGRHEAAVLTLTRAVERFPDLPQAYAALGHVWLEAAATRDDRVALNKAIEALSVATRHSDAGSHTFTDLGRAFLLQGDTRAAERALHQAMEKLPIAPDAYLHLATITARAGRVQEARDALVRYATLVGDAKPLAGIATQIADYSMRLGQPHIAMRWIERAITAAGANVVLLSRLAESAWQAGDHTRARAAVKQGLALAPTDRTLLAIERRLP